MRTVIGLGNQILRAVAVSSTVHIAHIDGHLLHQEPKRLEREREEEVEDENNK